METRRSKRIKLQNESRRKQHESGDGDVQRKGLKQNPGPDLSDDNANYELRVTNEHQVIHSVGLPMICWEQGMITAHLEEDDPDCLVNLINSSPYFREVFKHKRISFLSEKVLSIFCTWLNASENTNTWLNRKWLAGYSPNPFIKQKSLFNCRLVCRSWCSSIDKWIQHQLLNGVPARVSSDVFTRPSDELTVNKFFQHFEKTHPPLLSSRSPLVTRRLIILSRWSDVTEGFWNRIHSILRNYGDHIWHLDLEFSRNQEAGITAHRTYLMFRETLMLTPNLKTLYVHYDDYDHSRQNRFIFDEAFIRSHPLPNLGSLTLLRIEKAPREIFTHILSQNDHVTGLELIRVDDQCDHSCNVELANLVEFKMTVVFGGSTFVTPGTADWPVKKLNLDFFASEFLWHEQIFKIISDKWGQHCVEMRLILPNNNPGRATVRMCLNCRFNLPKVKVLVLEMNGNIMSMDVFLRMKSLERITISRKVDLEWVRDLCLDEDHLRSGAKSRIIQFTGFEKKMYKSNIWNMFPKLKYFKVDEMEYRRVEWIQKCKK